MTALLAAVAATTAITPTAGAAATALGPRGRTAAPPAATPPSTNKGMLARADTRKTCALRTTLARRARNVRRATHTPLTMAPPTRKDRRTIRVRFMNRARPIPNRAPPTPTHMVVIASRAMRAPRAAPAADVEWAAAAPDGVAAVASPSREILAPPAEPSDIPITRLAGRATSWLAARNLLARTNRSMSRARGERALAFETRVALSL